MDPRGILSKGASGAARHAECAETWNQLRGGVVIVLLVATVVSALLGHAGDAIAIAASVGFSVIAGFFTEWRADRALDALQAL